MHAAVESVLLKSERLVCHRANYLAAIFANQQHLSLKAIVLTTATKERVGEAVRACCGLELRSLFWKKNGIKREAQLF